MKNSPTTPNPADIDDIDIAAFTPPAVDLAKVVAGFGDEIDPAAIALPGDAINKGAVRQIFNDVPVARPGNSDWVFVFTDPNYRATCALYEPKKSASTSRPRPHLMMPAVVAAMEFGRGIRRVEIFTYCDRHGNLGLWPIGFTTDDRENGWLDTARDAAVNHAGKWINVSSDLVTSSYRLAEPVEQLAPPQPPALPLSKLLGIAFKGRVITSIEHPLMRELRGLFS